MDEKENNEIKKECEPEEGDSEKKDEVSIEGLKEKLEQCEKTKSEYLAGWQRARADFLNYKKDEVERIENLIAYSNEELILKILPIVDNFNLIAKKIPDNQKEDSNIKGLLQIEMQMSDFLKKYGVEEIKSIGEKFDPNLHEAVEIVESENCESGKIVDEIRKGYTINGRLLRPAKVKVVR